MSGFVPAALHAALFIQPLRAADVGRHMGAPRLNVNEDRLLPDILIPERRIFGDEPAHQRN